MTAKYLLLETRRAYRNRRFLIMTLVTPLILFLINSSLWGNAKDGTTAYLMASMAAFGAMTSAISVGMRVATERQVGWNRQLRLTPLRPSAYLVSKGLLAMLIAIPSILLVFAAGAFIEHVQLGAMQWIESGIGLWIALIPFAVLGLMIGYAGNPDSTGPIFSLVFMGMSLFGGLWFPVETLPDVMATIAKLLPSYWLGLIARGPLLDQSFDWLSVPVLLGWTVVLGLIVINRYRVDTARA
ncbi:ABC transporter permease [Flindersiella endophytica]